VNHAGPAVWSTAMFAAFNLAAYSSPSVMQRIMIRCDDPGRRKSRLSRYGWLKNGLR
jgi:hypothetical protein